jgi:hypothetical protein
VDFETVARDDAVHERYPERSGLGVSLHGMLNRDRHVARDFDTKTGKVPIRILVVDGHESRLIWGWGIRLCIGRVNFQTDEAFMGAQCKKCIQGCLIQDE